MSNKKLPEYILQINDFKQALNDQWYLNNDFGVIRVDLEKQEVFFRDSKDRTKDFFQQFDEETFDGALVTTYMRSGMYDYLRQNQEET